ncbi:hypothetical protein ZWY2020_045759 [Hordeum vulgare]|nr:hypothetical protein ZWY2020_045759 [Hordeum vulgare]
MGIASPSSPPPAVAAANQARPPDPSIPTPPHPTGGGMAAASASPSSPLPAAASPRPVSAEEQGRMVVASPPPPPLPAASPHPDYPEMIKQAMTELGGTCGRIAIAAFILGRFTGFPANHDKLLKSHLRRLVSEGVIRGYGSKLRACYVFPPSNTASRGRPRKSNLLLLTAPPALPLPAPPPTHKDDILDLISLDTSGGLRGRPRKDALLLPAPPKDFSDLSLVPSASRGLQTSSDSYDSSSSDSYDSASIDDDYSGDDDEYTPARAYSHSYMLRAKRKRKRGRGRSLKLLVSANAGASSLTKKGRGRPRKKQKLGSSQAAFQNGQDTESGSPNVSRWLKEGFGNPTTLATPPAAVRPVSRGLNIGSLRPTIERPPPPPRSAGTALDTVASTGMKKPLGRPRKKRSSKAVSAETGDGGSTGIKKLRGRPRKERPLEAMSAEAGDAAPAPETGNATPALETGDATAPAPEAGDATPAPETGDATPAPETGDAVPAETGAPAPAPEAGDAVAAPETRDAAASAPQAGDAVPAPGTGDAAPASETAAPAPEAGDAPPAPDENGAATPAKTEDGGSTGIKRPRGRPRKERPLEAMSTETGEAMPAPETGDAEPDENGAATPAEAGDAASTGFKKPRGRPRKEKPASALSAETGVAGPDETGDSTPAETGDAAPAGIKRPLGRPRKVKRGRPRKEKPEAAMYGETGDDHLGDLEMEKPTEAIFAETVDARSAETGAAMPGEKAGDSASAGIKKGRGRPRKERPEAAVSAESGDTALAATRPRKEKRGRPRKEKRGRPRKERPEGAISAESGDAAFLAARPRKEKRGRPRKERPEWAISAESGEAERPRKEKRGRPRKERPQAAISGESGDGALTEARPRKEKRGRPRKEKPASDDTMSMGIKGPLETPGSYALSAGTGKAVSTGTKIALESPRTAEKPSAGDIVSMVMRRRRAMPRSDQPSEAGRMKTSGGIFGYVRESSGKLEKEPGEGVKTQAKEGVMAAAGGGEETTGVAAEKGKAGGAAVEETGGATESSSNKLGPCAAEKVASAPNVEAVASATESCNKNGEENVKEAVGGGVTESAAGDAPVDGGEAKLGSADRCVVS